jgi:cysteine-rich repeat protein
MVCLVSGCFAPDADTPADLAESGTDTETEGSGSESASSSVSASVSSASGGTEPSETSMDPSSSDASSLSSSSSSSSSTTTAAVCGDGVVDEDEACDDGNEEDADACSNACVAGFYTGTLDPCSDYAQVICGYFAAQCHVDPNGGELRAVCYWPEATTQDACDGTPGIWTPSDGAFAMGSGFDFPEGGACITQQLNLRCESAADNACESAGASMCVREVDIGGGELDEPPVCWWDTDEAGCVETPGLWTEPDSGFGLNHPNTLPPGEAACILQVSALP